MVLETSSKKMTKTNGKSSESKSICISYFLSLRRTGELGLGRRCKSIIDNDLIGTDDALGTQEPDRGVDIKPSGEHGEWRCSGSSCSSMLILLLLLELLIAQVTKEFLLKLASLLGGAVS